MFRLLSHCIFAETDAAAFLWGKGGVGKVKRVQSACIFQTLVFCQKEELMLSKDRKLAFNREEVEKYKASLEKNGTKYQITNETQTEDGSIVIHVRKQYNDKTDVSEYFE